MPDIETTFTAEQMAAIRAAAERAGVSVQEFIDVAASTAVEHKYVLPKAAARVLTFQGLKSAQ